MLSHRKVHILRTAKKIYLVHNKTLLDFETPDTIIVVIQQLKNLEGRLMQKKKLFFNRVNYSCIVFKHVSLI